MPASLEQRSSRPIVVVALATALCLTGDSMLYIALPIYWHEVGLEALWQVGVLLSVNRLIRLPFNPLIGWLYQRISLRAGLLLATTLGTLTTLGYGIAKGFIAWLLLRALWGIGWSFFRIGGLSAVVYCAAGQSRGQAMGLYNGLYRLGSLVGMLLGGLLVPVYGLPALALSFAAMALLGLPLLLRHFQPPAALDERQLPAAPAADTPRRSARLNGKYRVIVSGFCTAMLIQGVLAATLSALIERFYGNRLDLFGLLLSATALSGILQALRWSWEPWLGRRFGAWSDGPRGRSRLYGGTLLVAALSFGLMASGLPLLPWLAVTLLVMRLATAPYRCAGQRRRQRRQRRRLHDALFDRPGPGRRPRAAARLPADRAGRRLRLAVLGRLGDLPAAGPGLAAPQGPCGRLIRPAWRPSAP